MPLYDYRCTNCGHVFELRQSFESVPEADCPKCENKARRKFHAVPIIYKGSGFYTTDYKHTNYSPPSKSEDSSKNEDSSKTSDSSKSGDSTKSKESSAKEKSESGAVSSSATTNDS